jgi:hypothetical protein
LRCSAKGSPGTHRSAKRRLNRGDSRFSERGAITPPKGIRKPAKLWNGQFPSTKKTISGKEIDWEKLIASGEWVGRKMEEEIDVAQRQESRDRSRGDDTSGD